MGCRLFFYGAVIEPRAKRIAGEVPERFWPKVQKAGPDECWLWTAALDAQGYGVFNIGKNKIVHASRISWVLCNGAIADGLFVCHKCDNPKCVNPGHLFLGTAKQNSDDKISKGRLPLGEQLHNSKLTKEKVSEIKEKYKSGTFTQRKLAEIYGVHSVTISKVILGKLWRHIGVPA